MTKRKQDARKSEKVRAEAKVPAPPRSAEGEGRDGKNPSEKVLIRPDATTWEEAVQSRAASKQADSKQGSPPSGTSVDPQAGNRPVGAQRFPVVGIGASAGGLASIEAIFKNMPADHESGLSFVIVQHLDPDHKSIMSDLIQRHTRMHVFEVTEGMRVEPNCIYIIPPNKDMEISVGRLHLMPPSARRGLRLPIDFFFRSLANLGEDAIGVILSGNGTDGTLGLRAIKEAGGMSIVQKPETAEYDGMPRSAILAGLADCILPPDEIVAQLLGYVKRTNGFPAGSSTLEPAYALSVTKLLALLHAHTGHDFTNYKQNTVRRRVERRMAVNRMETIEAYVQFLRDNPGELVTLFHELLIGVTAFFRDGAAFDALRDMVLPIVLTERPPGSPIRLWVPACSTGEEAYSLSMLILEAGEKLGREVLIQVFATDIDAHAIDKARTAIYPANIEADVSPERLSRFFVREDNNFYRIKKSLRDQLVFAVQDVTKDPPFSKLDLISCRNMLIYMESILQKRLIPLFHYSLAPGGFLLLGNSESVGEFTNLFTVLDRKWKLYRRREPALGSVLTHGLGGLSAGRDHLTRAPMILEPKQAKASLRELTEGLLLRHHSPACVIVNGQGDILYIHGRSGRYLEVPSGDVNLNLVRSAREGLKLELAEALRRVQVHKQPISYERLEVRTNGGFEPVNVTVELAESLAAGQDLILITFRDAPTLPTPTVSVEQAKEQNHLPADGKEPSADKDPIITHLERELRVKGETLQTTIEELETANEELKSTNEELQSTNEELQSTNEELETSKEELQSVNEELVTVNSELQQKMDNLSRANNDMNNLLAGTGIGMLFVDHQLGIQRFTPATTQIINLIQTDIGRPISDLVSNLEGYDSLAEDVKAVLDSLIPREAEVHTRDGRWFLMRILPYRTVDNVIEGAVLTFVDIGGQKRVEERFRNMSSLLETQVRERTAAYETADQRLRQEVQQRQVAESRRATDIAALTRLHDLTARLAPEEALHKLYQASVEASLGLTRADMGMLHLYNRDRNALELIAHRGLPANLLEALPHLSLQTDSGYEESVQHGKTILLQDVEETPGLASRAVLKLFQKAGVHSVQLTPVLGPEGVRGILTSLWSRPFHVDPGTVQLSEMLARQLSELIATREPLLGSPPPKE